MVTGFSNARTSEYMILNNLYETIKSKCSLFYPFYFYKNRDDTRISLLNDIHNLHLIACFARRPKTDYPLSKYTNISFRRSMFEQVNFFRKYEIPVLAAAPLGTGIEEIGFGAKCQWFKLSSGIDFDYIEYEFDNYIIDTHSQIEGVNLLDNDSLYSFTPFCTDS